MSFDSSDYFATKLSQIDITAKKLELLQASQAKIKNFNDTREASLLAEQQRIQAEELAKKSWAGRLDLEKGTLASDGVNLAASLASGASRLAGQVVNLPINAFASLEDSQTTPEQLAAYNRYQTTGELTSAQDMAVLNQKIGSSPYLDSTEGKAWLAANPGKGGPTALDTFKSAQKARDVAGKVQNFFDLTGIVNQTKRDVLAKELGSDFSNAWNEVKEGWSDTKDGKVISGSGNLIAGLTRLVYNAGEAAITNPGASAEYIVENAPQLAIGAAGKAGGFLLGTTNVAYAADTYREGIKAYQDAHGQEMPDASTKREMALYAASLALAEHVGDMSLLKGMDTVGDAVTSAKKALLNTAKETGKGALTEGLTEGYQTYAEGEIKNYDKDYKKVGATPLDIYTGATIGAIAGGVMSGGVHGLNEIGEGSARRAKAKTPIEDTPKYQETFKKAVADNNPDVFLDKESANYNPVAAVGVLLQASKVESATPEIKTANFAKATDIVESLEQERDTLINGNQQEIADKKVQIASFEKKLASVDSADEVKTNAIKGLIDQTKLELTEIESKTDTSSAEIKKLDSHLTVARRVQNELGSLANPVAADDFKNLVASVSSREKGVASAAADKLINLSMTSPGSVDNKVLSNLVNDRNNGLKPEQRASLRVLTETRKRENSLMNMGGVSAQILTGDPKKGQLGIKDYREMIGTALASGNQKAVERPLDLMAKFLASHSEKAALTLSALKTGEVRQVVRLDNGKWEIRDPALKPLTQKQMTESGSVTVNPAVPASVALVETIGKEAKILAGSYDQISKAVKAKFPSTSVKAPVLSINVLEEEQGKPRPELNSGVKASQTQTTPSNKVDSTQKESTKANEAKVDESSVSSTSQPSGSSVADAPSATVVPSTTNKVSKEAQAALDSAGLDINDLINSLSREDILSEIEHAQAEIEATNTSIATRATSEVSTGNPVETTGKQAAAEQQDVAQAESPVAEAVVAYKGLKVFNQKVKELTGNMQEVFLKTNLIAQFLKQKLNSDKYKSARPLVGMEDFISAWKANTSPLDVFLKDFLEKDEVLSQEQDTALKHMRDFIGDLLPKFNIDLVEYTGDPAFKARDPMQYLMDKSENNIDVEENIKSAMAYSVYSFLLTQANNPASLERDQVNTMHSKPEEEILTEEAYGELSKYNSFEQTFIDSVGSVAVQALGFVPDENAPIDLLPNLVTAMGIRIMAVMERDGFISRESRNAREVEILMNPANDKAAYVKFGPNVEFNYIVFNREKDGKTLTGPVKMLRDMNAGTGGITDRLFGSEKAARQAGTKPSKFTQKFAKDTQQDISEAQRKVIQDTMNTPHTAIPAMIQLFSLIGRTNVLKAAGWVALTEDGSTDKNTHEINIRSVEAQNQNLENQFDKMMEMYESNEPDQEYFVEQFVGKNFRAYFGNQSLNQQTSKIHRFAFQRPGWEVEFDLSNDAQINEYKVAIAMSLGVKTDGQLNSKTLAEFDSWLAKETKISQAIELIRAGLVEGTDVLDSEANKTVIGEAAASAEGMMSLQAMVSYAHYLQAVKNGDTKFKTTMLVGVDGKTNGPMLSHLALGAATDLEGFYTLLNRGGFYSDAEGQAKHYSEYAAKGGRDLYQDFGMAFLRSLYRRTIPQGELSKKLKHAMSVKTPQAWKDYFAFVSDVEVDAMQTITGNLITEDGLNVTSAGRNLPKTPLTSFAFGSSINKSITNMENKFIEMIYTNVEAISSGNKKAPTREEFITSLNILIARDYKAPQIPLNMTVDQMMKKDFLNDREAAIRKAFKQIMKNPVENTMYSYFGVFIDRRKSLVNTVQASYSAYATAYEALRNTEIDSLINSGEIAHRVTAEGEKIPLHAMSVKQERDLRAKVKSLLPVMHSDYSIRENNIDSGIYMAKSERRPTEGITNKAKVVLGAPLKGSDQKNIEAQSIERTEISPGVAGASYPIHSGDSAIIHKTMEEIDEEPIVTTVNVHDEASNAVDKVIDVAKAMNKNTMQTFLDYSPAREAVYMLERILTNVVSGIKDGTIHKSAVTNMFEQWLETYNKGLPEDSGLTINQIAQHVIEDTYANAYAADSMRLEGLSHLDSVDQYTWEGGQFNDAEAMAAFRKEAADKLANLKPNPTSEVLKMVDFLNKTYLEEEVGLPTYDGSTVSQELDSEYDEQTKAISTVLIGLPGTLAMNAVEQIKNKFLSVYTSILSGESVVEAISKLEHAARADILQMLTKMASKLPLNVSPWGTLGESTGHNANLLALFDGKESITLKELAPVLFQELKTAGSMSDSYHLLLKQAMRSIDNDLKIVLVRPDTPADAILDKGASNARGWYVSKNDDQAIYVLSPDFAHARVNPELLVHELVHGALARVMEAELANPTDTAVGKHVKNLQALLEEARSFVKENKIKGVEAALVNVHELVSWGLTNKNFQKNVLGKMTSGVVTKSSGLMGAMKHFINELTRILFKGMKLDAEAKASNGLMVLAVNAAALYDAAKSNKQRLDITTNQEADPVSEMEAMTTEELYDKLQSFNGEQVDPAHDEHLRKLLNGIVTKIHGPAGTFKAELMKRADLTGTEIFAEALTSGQVPFGSEALNIGGMTEQEAYVLEQVEATVAAALSDDGAQVGIVHRELLSLYEEMRAKLKVEHFHVVNATPIEVQEAKEIYDFLFKIESGTDGKSDYLARFAAIGLVHKEVRDAMKIATNMRSVVAADTDFLSRLMVWFEKALGMISAKLTKTFPGMNADQKLGSLVQQLVDAEAKRKRIELLRAERATPVSDGMTKISEGVREKLVDFGQSKFFKQGNVLLKTMGEMTSVYAGDRFQMFGKTLNGIRDAELEGRQGLLIGIVREMMGTAKDSVVYDFLLRATKRIEGQRKDIMTGVTKLVLEGFANKGKDLDQSDKRAVSAGVLRVDMGILLASGMGMKEINVLIQNEKALDREIVLQEAKLTTKFKHYHIYQSRLLGYHMATGDARDAMVMLNAHNIANMYETDYVGRMTEAEVAEAEKVIDVLATLHGMKHTRTSDKIRLKKIFKSEMARNDGGNGLELVMKMHTQLQQESKERLFTESAALFMKGYTSEIYNPYKSVMAATAEEGKELELQGWKRGDPVVADTEASDQEQRWLYTMRDGGQSRRVSGTISNTGMRSRGTGMHDGVIDDSSSLGRYQRKQMDKVSEAKRNAVRNMFKANPSFDPSEANTGKQFMLPVLNAEGKIANWRYMMKQSTKDRVLDRDNRFEQILGAMAGSIYDKQTSKGQNREVIKALKQQYDLEYGMKPQSYVTIGPMVSDPEFREIYNLLPQDTKDAVREMFGKDEMKVRVDLLDLNFGYRKLSWADAFSKAEQERDIVDKMMIESLSYVFGKKAQLRVRQGQLWWQTAVQMTKDNMVVKSFSTLAGNFKSNVTELLWFGVSPLDIIKHHRVAFRGALDYRRDSTELFDLQEKLKLDYMVGPQRKEMEARVIILTDAVNRNPIKGMIDAGLMPTIVEDVDMQEDIHSYKSRFVRATEKVTKHLNPQLVTAGKWVLMTQDTPLYKWMSHGTQLSDFVARYTLYQHITTRKDNRMEKDAAVQLVSDAFVNYDTPSHRRMQALNDDGFVWFTKYYLRIQRVIGKLVRENPARTLGMVGLEAYFSTVPTLLDSAVSSRLGNNPFSTGALKFPSSIDDTMVIKNMMKLIK